MARFGILAVWTLVAEAYDRDGHEAVGMTAMSAITGGKVLNTLKKLLRGKDAMDVAGWAHLVDEKYPWTEAFHWQKYKLDPSITDPEQQCEKVELVTEGPDCENNMCLVQVLKHFFGTLVFGKDDPRTVKTSFPNDVVFTDADAVKFLINLLGDMHQPLHFMEADGKGLISSKSEVPGSKITIKVPGKGDKNTEAETNLYELWDQDLIRWTKNASPMFWDGGWTNIHRGHMFGVDFNTGNLYETEKKELKKGGAEAFEKFFERWALESAKYACWNVYRDPLTRKPIEAGFLVAPADYDTWKNNLLVRLLISGARVAIMINAVVDFKPEAAQQMQSGSGVEVVDPQDKAVWNEVIPDHNLGPSKLRENWLPNLLTNLCIFAVELSVLLLFLRYTQPPASKRFSEIQLGDLQNSGHGTEAQKRRTRED